MTQLLLQAVLQHFDGAEAEREVVNAKFVVGTDGECLALRLLNTSLSLRPGAHSWVRKAMGIQLEGGQTGNAHIIAIIGRQL